MVEPITYIIWCLITKRLNKFVDNANINLFTYNNIHFIRSLNLKHYFGAYKTTLSAKVRNMLSRISYQLVLKYTQYIMGHRLVSVVGVIKVLTRYLEPILNLLNTLQCLWIYLSLFCNYNYTSTIFNLKRFYFLNIQSLALAWLPIPSLPHLRPRLSELGVILLNEQ